jgi:hypothetical protein
MQMLDRSFIEKIVELDAPTVLEVAGRQYASKVIVPVKDPAVPILSVGTLEGFADYIEANIDGLEKTTLIIHVIDFNAVSLLSKLDGSFPQRNTYIQAKSESLKFSFGQYYDVESFNIALQSMFIQDGETANVLKVVGNVKEEGVRQFNDNGITQEVTVKAGISRVENIAVPNPVVLRPFRTFVEIEQPASKFVFRMKSGKDGQPPTCALFEADGGKWKQDAIEGIARWLRVKITDIPIIS